MNDPLFDKGATMIALRPLPSVGGRAFAPGDAFPWRQLALSERRVRQMVDQRKVGTLTQETLDFAMRQRPLQDVPRGFTADGLKAMGLELPKRSKKARPDDPGTVVGTLEGATVHRERYQLVSTKVGNFTRYDVFNLAGERLNPGGTLNGLKQVDKFIDNLEAEQARLLKEAQEAEQAAAMGKKPAEAGEAAPETPANPVSPELDPDGDGEMGGGVKAQPDWSTFPEDPAEWTAEHHADFDRWFDSLPKGAEITLEHPGAIAVFTEKSAGGEDYGDAGTSE